MKIISTIATPPNLIAVLMTATTTEIKKNRAAPSDTRRQQFHNISDGILVRTVSRKRYATQPEQFVFIYIRYLTRQNMLSLSLSLRFSLPRLGKSPTFFFFLPPPPHPSIEILLSSFLLIRDQCTENTNGEGGGKNNKNKNNTKTTTGGFFFHF